MTDEQNMADLFANLNAISANSVLRDRQVRGGGGGSMPLQGNQDPNPLIALNPYLGKNVTSFNMGGMMNQRNMLAPYISTQMMTPLGRYNEGGKNKTAATPQEENLVTKILELAGVTIKQPDLVQFAAQEDLQKTQLEKQ